MKQWNKIFKERGRVFIKPHEDLPKIVKVFERYNVKKILDLGCGTGRHMVFLAKQGFDVYGIDIAEEGIKIAEDWLKQEKLEGKFKIGSIYKRLPYSDNSFDAVISTHALHHEKIESIRKAIKEIYRILNPGGLVFIVVRKRNCRGFHQGAIIKKHGKQKVSYRVIAPRTYVPLEGGEKGLIHYLFNRKLIKKEFYNFQIHDIWTDSQRTYSFWGQSKKEPRRKMKKHR